MRATRKLRIIILLRWRELSLELLVLASQPMEYCKCVVCISISKTCDNC